MATYGDIVIEHVDLYGSVHTHCIVIRRCTQVKLTAYCIAVRCRVRSVATVTDSNAIVPIDNNGK